MPAIPTSAQRHKTLSQPIEVVPDVSVISPAPVAIGTTCGDACAKSCDPVANSLRRWYGQVGAVLLRPTWSDNTAFLSQSATGANSSQDLEYDWTVMPRGEFGFQCCGGFGMRARYMYFNDTSQTAAVTTPAGGSFSSAAPLGIRDASATAGDTATAFGTLLFHLGDIEFQQEFRWGCWSLRGSAGGRFAYVDQDYTYGRISGGVATAGLLSESQFIGGGPTIALEGRRYFPRVHTAVYGIGRASLLWGRAEETVSGTAGTAVRNEDLTLPMFDFEAGFEWWVDIHRVRLFAQLGVIGQVWYGLGNSSNSSPNFTSGATGVGGLPGFEANANSRRDMTLLGVTLSVGIQF